MIFNQFSIFNSRFRGAGPRCVQQQFDGLSDSAFLITDAQPLDTPSPISINPGDISGGSTSTSIAASAEQIEEFVQEGARPKPKFYGRHFIAGILLVHKYIKNTPPTNNESYVAVAIGEGQGDGGGHGELEGAEKVWYSGEELPANPAVGVAGYRFYNGYISTGVASGPQQVDAYFSSTGLAYSGTGYIALRVPTAYANVEDRPDKVRGIYLGRRTNNYDSTGRVIGYDYSTNPARVAADLVLSYYDHKYPLDAALALRKTQDKIDWEAWKTWHDFNAASISWDDGTTTRSIPRFECHIAFTDDINLADALNQVCASCGAFWQDDGKQLIFLPPSEREPVHHFHPGNMLSKGISVEPRDLRNAHNIFTGQFRDQDEEFLGLASVEVRLESLVKQCGKNKVTHALTSMNQSQARRLMRMRARLESENANICAFIGDARSYRVLPGDFVTVSHPTTGWSYQRCLILSSRLASAENGVDSCEFTAQQIDGPLHFDTDHQPRQGALTP